MAVRRDEATPRRAASTETEGCVCLQFMQADSRRRMCRSRALCVFCPRARPTIACHQADSLQLAVCLHTIARHSPRPVFSQHTPLSSLKQHVKSSYCSTQRLVRDGSGIGPPRLAPLTPRAYSAKWSEFDRDSLCNLIFPRDTTAVLRVLLLSTEALWIVAYSRLLQPKDQGPKPKPDGGRYISGPPAPFCRLSHSQPSSSRVS